MPLAPVRQGHEWDALSRLDEPLRWRKPRTVFVARDLFCEDLPDESIDRVFAVMALCPQHCFVVPTKRPQRMRQYLESTRLRWEEWLREIDRMGRKLPLAEALAAVYRPLPNVQLGVSVEDQATADALLPPLLATPAAVRFVSAELLLGPIDLWGARYPAPGGGKAGAISCWQGDRRLDFVIVGPGARPCEVEWIRSLTEQCKAAGVKCWGVRSSRARKE